AMTLMATNKTTTEASAMRATVWRERDFMRRSSIRLLQVHQHRVGEEEKCDDGKEENGIACIDDAAHDGVEMRQEAERRDGAEQRLGRPAFEEAQHDRRAADREEKADGGGDDERDHLVLGEGGERRANGEEGARHEEAPDIARDNNAIVGIAEIVDGDPKRKGQKEGNAGEGPAREELAENRRGHRNRQCQEELDRAALALLGPKPHRKGGDEHEIEPGMKGEEGLQVRLTALEKIAEEERKRPGHDEKDDDEDIGERRGEIALQLAAEDHESAVHGDNPLSGTRRWEE